MASVTPGPCPSTGCPAPTEIDCIVVDKVYDSCTQTITVTQTVTPTAVCTVTGCSIDLSTSSCTVGAVTPTLTPNYNDITFVIAASYSIACSAGVSLPETADTTVTVTLYNPAGTTPSCSILSGSCTCVNLPNGSISCTLTLCLLFQTTATVQLLVPSYGFCEPAPCPQVGPVLACPPSPLFPPQAS
ncbi:MAG: hypothetical protein K6U14_02265 [Firmicutes bacterium]|nr:hypothetical protein [Alicyclobacillaceae bacterium]MCL6496445.1 hypothetical protein [Bacillota bacterium]